MNKTFRMTPKVAPYYVALTVYTLLVAMLLPVLLALYMSYNSRAVAGEQGVSVEGTAVYNATIRYADIVEAALVPVDQESAYYPRGIRGADAHDGFVGEARLPDGQVCVSFVARSYAEGVYLEDTAGTCYLLTVQNAQGLMDVIERGTSGASLSGEQHFYRIPKSGLYYVFVVLIVGFLLAASFVFAGVRRRHKAYVRAIDHGILIRGSRRWNAEIPYAAIKNVDTVPVGYGTEYHPKNTAWYHSQKARIGQFALANGRACTTLFSYDYAEGLFLETMDGGCYLFTVEKADQLLDLIERKRAQLSTA